LDAKRLFFATAGLWRTEETGILELRWRRGPEWHTACCTEKWEEEIRKMEAIVIGTTFVGSITAAFWLQKAALEAFFKAVMNDRRAR
jgi:hypothetical protein